MLGPKISLYLAIIALSTSAVSADVLNRGRGLGGNIGIVNCPLKPSPLVYPTIPASYDLRAAFPECMTPILNQGACGCCWAFAAAQTLTERFCIQSDKTIKRLLSPQDLIECDHSCQFLNNKNCNNGCSGGYLDNAWSYLKDNGIVGWSCMPYTATDTAQCPASKCNATMATKYYANSCYRLGSVKDIQTEILQNGPVEAGFYVYDDFMTYSGGVYVHKADSPLIGGHAVRLIGWGTENGVDYWLAANQWSTNWGDKGLFKIKRGTDESNIESSVIAGMADIASLQGKVEYEDYSIPLSSSPPILDLAGGSLNHGIATSVCWFLLFLALSLVIII